MPRFSFTTNVPALQIPDDFLKTSTALLSKTLGKNIAYCISSVNPNFKMTLGGSNEPCGLIEVSSIGGIGIEENKKCIAVLTDHIQKNVGIPKDKLFMHFQPNIMESVGYLGTTFHHLCIVEKRKRLD